MPASWIARPSRRRLWRLAFVVAGLALVASAGYAQRRRGGGGFFGGGIKWATPADFDGAFMFCRIAFRQSPYGDGDGWSVDYPRADLNLSFRFSELTSTIVSRESTGGFNHVVLRLTDPLLYRCPFV